jgi:hypothetical protein
MNFYRHRILRSFGGGQEFYRRRILREFGDAGFDRRRIL